MFSLKDNWFNVASARKDRVRLVWAFYRQAEISKQPRESNSESRNSQDPLCEQALEEHFLKAGFTEPKPLGVYLGKPWEREY